MRRLDLQVLGAVALRRDDHDIPMISSRKTRALLAYLAMTGRPHAREHLCELFFDNTNDPRGALRWSLSRLRAVFAEDAGQFRVENDTVLLDMTHIQMDLHFVQNVVEDPFATTADLLRSALLLSRNPIGHLRLPRCEDFEDWMKTQQTVLDDLRGEIIQKLVAAPDIDDENAIKWLRHWVRHDPRSLMATHALWHRLNVTGQQPEANAVAKSIRDIFGDKPGQWYQSSDAAMRYQTLQRDQTIKYCTTSDGVRIAHASIGKGPPLVKAANWLNHLELDWDSPIWGNTLQALSARNTLIRYDERGNGLSDWDVPEISQAAFVDDLETVVDHQGIDRFSLLGMSQGCAVSIAYAVRYPERVSCLILIGGYAAGWRMDATPSELEQREAVLTLTRHGWGTANPAYRHIFSQTFMPGADADRLAWFDDFQRQTTSPENAVRFQEAFGDIDVRDLLGQVKAPTLVLHARDDQRIALRHGEALAAGIPNARLVTLESANHIILGDEPAWQVCMAEIKQFLDLHEDR